MAGYGGDAVLEAGRATPALPVADGVKCLVTAIAGDMVSYAVSLPVADPGVSAGPRDEFLSRFWYVAQRRGLRLGVPQSSGDAVAPPDAGARLQMLTTMGAFHADAEALSALALASAFRRYRRTDIVQILGAPMTSGLLVVSGALSVLTPGSDGDVAIERVGPGQLLVLQETLTSSASPVRVVASEDADVLTIPAESLYGVMERNRLIARDVAALAESRRLAIRSLKRGLRAAA